MDVEQHVKVIDDSLLWHSNIEQAWEDTTKFLSKVGGHGVILNGKKFNFAKREAEFAGFRLYNGTIRPLEKHVKAIREFPEPSSLTDLRSFMALVEQISYCFPIKNELLLNELIF